VDIDETALGKLIEESQDTHADALRAAREPLRDMVDLGRQARAGGDLDPDENRAFAGQNRRRMAGLARRAGGLLAATGVIAAVADFVGSPAFASSGTDVQVLRTASAIEVLAVSTYKTALGLSYIGGSEASAFLKQFAKTTMLQHSDHLGAFQSATRALGGAEQDKPDPAFTPVVDAAVKSIGKSSAAEGTLLVVALALELENIAAQTYVNNMSLLASASAKKVTASVMGIEAQHVAILTAVQALLKAGDGGDVKLPPAVASLPATAGSVGFPHAFYPTSDAAPASQGAK
jgi:hypothetical protein